MTPKELLATLAFSETKDLGDGMNVINVVKNRALEPKRYGEGLEGVIYKPKQFSGEGGKEWDKAKSGKMTAEEKAIYNQFLTAADQALTGALPDTTDGATHYFNPKLANPKWAEKMKKVHETEYHTYYKEE